MSDNIYKNDHYFYNKALILAKNGEHRVRVGCLAVVNGKAVAGAWNVMRNPESAVDYTDISVHAEIACLNMISERIRSNATLYIARIGVRGTPLPSHPCQRCIVTLREAGIKRYCAMDGELREHGPDYFLTKYKLN